MINNNLVALLATGDELNNGDILNTNSPNIARVLSDNSISVGMHAITSDRIEEIEIALQVLLKHHRALIITGGLGPTSDDLTRFALSNVLQQPLVFDETTWQAIIERFKQFSLGNPPESNRQQALFPPKAIIIPNPNGTAAGCMISFQEQWIFMLPGPPAECMPMVDEYVLPQLKKAGFPQQEFRRKWLLFGVSEGHMAEKLDELMQNYECRTGYRIAYPYLEFKLFSKNAEHFNKVLPEVETLIAPYLIQQGERTASDLLQEKIITLNAPLVICDLATGSLLESTLKTPKTFSHLRFTQNENEPWNILIKGMEGFWLQQTYEETSLEITIRLNQFQKQIATTLPYRGERIKYYVVEFICWEILKAQAKDLKPDPSLRSG